MHNKSKKIKHKIPVIVVLGFLEAGKTTFIQQLIEDLLKREKGLKPALLSCENGETTIKPETAGKLLAEKEILQPERFRQEVIREFITAVQPDIMILEYNGTWSLALLQEALPADSTYIQSIITVQNGELLDLQLAGMGNMLQASLSQSNIVVLSEVEAIVQTGASKACPKSGMPDEMNAEAGAGKMNKKSKLTGEILAKKAVGTATKPENSVLRKLKANNSKLKIFSWKKNQPLPDKLLKAVLREKFTNPMQFLFFGLAIWAIWLLKATLALPEFAYWQAKAEQTGRYFWALIFQIIPFLLVAALVSAVLQILVSDEKIRSWFSKPLYMSIPLAMFSGSILPICDCGLVPIVSRLIKKGTKPYLTIIFFVASTVTNPLVILSTIYAFPGQPTIYVYRLLIVLAVGMILSLLTVKLLKHNADFFVGEVAGLSCVAVNVNRNLAERKYNKFILVIRHSMQEFFTLLPYVLIGTFLSSLAHAFVDPGILRAVGENKIILYFLTILGMFFLAVCANSNAFIAKSFVGLIPLPATLLYMAFAPLLDLKNLLLLSTGFGRKLTLRYIFIILAIFTLMFILFINLPASVWPRLVVLN